MEDKSRYVFETEVARITGMAVQTLRNDRSYGRGIPYCKVGRSVRYLLDDVYSFMERHKIQPRQNRR
jgi:hypothetical protein